MLCARPPWHAIDVLDPEIGDLLTQRTFAHFIGIGGAGMSGIAKVLHERGSVVTGSDLKDSRYARMLSDAGIRVSIGHDPSNLGDPDLVVVSSAIPEHNPELEEARRRGLEVWPRARMLAHLAEGCKTVAVAGTHGKTTTSSMVATALRGTGMDPTFLIGGELNDIGSNAYCGTGDVCVMEADESDGSFLYLDPVVAVVTNIEDDHLDHYGNTAALWDAFGAFIERIGETGTAVVCADDERLVALAEVACRGRLMTYGCHPGADVVCSDMERDGKGHRFTLSTRDGLAVGCRLAVPGLHNVVNATGALAAVIAVGGDVSVATECLGRFAGVRRRMERVGEAHGVVVMDDYAHHPTEVRATLGAASGLGASRVWAVFQPHRYSRTAALGSEFGTAFSSADRVVLMDVYGAGEAPIPGVSGRTILEALLSESPRSRVAYFPHRTDVLPYLAGQVRSGDLVLTLGAGDVTAMGPELIQLIDSRDTGGA